MIIIILDYSVFIKNPKNKVNQKMKTSSRMKATP